jgi:predicted mannosyl-3-phosphoglycerate phosphatase (HAD superfamily)
MSTEPASFSHTLNRSMLVLTCVDGALREPADRLPDPARETLATLARLRIPVILTSHHRIDELLALQREYGLHEPFIAESGRWLYIPRRYFPRLPPLSNADGEWEVIEFAPASVEEAIDMLMWLYRISGDSPLLVGLGVSWNDRSLLRHVDVPVVVRSEAVDQRQLRDHFPDAYVTSLAGPHGWREAILGAGIDE